MCAIMVMFGGLWMGLKGLDSEDLYYGEDILAEMDRHNEVFDLKDFYKSGSFEFVPNSTGFRVITKDKQYSGYVYPYSNSHDIVLENILFALYGDEYNKIYRQTGYNIREASGDLGAVFIQMLSKHYTLVWIPNSLSEFQCDSILKFFSEMEEINKALSDKIEFGVGIKKDGNYADVDVDEAISILPTLAGKKKVM